MIYNYDYDYWSVDHSVTFDGENRQIIVNPYVTEIDVQTDVYSSWKEWSQVRDNLKFLPALRATGGDPIGGGQYAGDIYFLTNGWTFHVNVTVTKVTGVLFSDDYDTAYRDLNTAIPMYPAKVSSIVNTVNISGGSSAYEFWNHPSRTLTSTPIYNGPTPTQIRNEIDTNSSALASIKSKTDSLSNGPTAIEIAARVRNELTPELSMIIAMDSNPGLTTTQATMLLEMYHLLGLDPTKPLVVTTNSRTAGSISQSITTNSHQTVVTRV